MLNEVWIVVNYNLYESKKHFVQKLSEAFRRGGVGTRIIDIQTLGPDGQLQQYANLKLPTLVCSFNRAIPDPKTGKFFWEALSIPYLSILVDPAYYATDVMKAEYSIISCVDFFDCEFLRQHQCKNVLFLPHAVERELAPAENQERPFDVVFLGSCYDHIGLREKWKRKYPPFMIELMDGAIEATLSQTPLPFWQAVANGIAQRGLRLSQEDTVDITTQVDNYLRGLDRWELIRSIKDAHVHVFGGTCWGDLVKGWPHYFAGMPNVTVHPAIPFTESMEILKKSRICLNSMPFFKNGTHERIFTGLACGSLPMTMDNLWVENNFVDGKELLLYQPKKWNEVNEKVNHYLNNENERADLALKGREKVMRHHTWDQRVEQLLKEIPPLLRKMVGA